MRDIFKVSDVKTLANGTLGGPVAIVIQLLYAHRIYLISQKRWLLIMIICVSHQILLIMCMNFENADGEADVIRSIC